jgi:SNF2 family DNA or RNA helicase
VTATDERTYGTILHHDDAWWIECEPQVALRFKRVFPKVKQDKQMFLCLSDTPENGRELAWFLQRYPMQMADRDRAHLGQREQQHRAFCADIGRILAGDYQPREYKLALPLREYQRVGADLALRTRGLLIGDDVGIGKTAQAIGVLSDPACRPALVVTLTHLPQQWKAELERFLPGIRVHILKKGQPYPLEGKTLFDRGMPDVLISNYHKLAGWAGELRRKVKSVIFDEVHELRIDDSHKYRAAQQIASKARLRLGLSATPIFNYGAEFRNIVEILKPGALGTKAEFDTEWCESKGLIKNEKAFGGMLREAGLMLRRTRVEVGRELAALTKVPHVFEADGSEIARLAGPAADLARIILQQGGSGFEKLRASEEFSWRLRQATGIAKAPFVADFVRLLVEQGERVLLFGWHRDVYSLWADRLKDLEPVFFTGEESPSQKEESRQAFLTGKTKVLIMSLRAGQGLDGLQAVCRTVVFGELDWSPAVHEQAVGRIHRDGQADPVCAYFLMADTGSDPVIADVLGIKAAQLDGIRDPNADLVQPTQSDPERIKKLALDFLRQRGLGGAEDAA